MVAFLDYPTICPNAEDTSHKVMRMCATANANSNVGLASAR
jgi:hypothetical protein